VIGGKPAEPGTAELIRRLEQELLLPEVRKSVTQVAALLAEEFVEIGSSGPIYHKQQIIDRRQRSNRRHRCRQYPISIGS
jgi:hypothetical protein